MKKLSAMLLALICVLGLFACTAKDPEAGNTAETDPPETVTPDAELKAELLEKYGAKFEFYLAFDMQLINFNFDETTVVRQHFDSLKNEQPTHNGIWDIVDGELVVSGEWNESFILNLESNTAISKSDGREYPIYKAE